MQYSLVILACLASFAMADEPQCYEDVCPAGSTTVIYTCYKDCDPGQVDEGLLCRKKGSIITYVKKTVKPITVPSQDCKYKVPPIYQPSEHGWR